MSAKKQVPLRISQELYQQLAAWAEDDFRSINGQIEFLLTQCVRQHRKNQGYVPKSFSKPLTVDLEEKDEVNDK